MAGPSGQEWLEEQSVNEDEGKWYPSKPQESASPPAWLLCKGGREHLAGDIQTIGSQVHRVLGRAS